MACAATTPPGPRWTTPLNPMREIRAGFLLLLLWGCAKRVPLPPPVAAPPPVPAVSPEGAWEAHLSGDKLGRLLLRPGGTAVFQGGMEFLNPAEWDWDPMRKKLFITLPHASDKQMQIFYMYIGHGVQYVDLAHKTVAYHFDDQTSGLNVAGWIFNRPRPALPSAIPAEPVLK
jgi:hypothetical protein